MSLSLTMWWAFACSTPTVEPKSDLPETRSEGTQPSRDTGLASRATQTPESPSLQACRQAFSWMPEVRAVTLTARPPAWHETAEGLFLFVRPFCKRSDADCPASLGEGLAAGMMMTSEQGDVSEPRPGHDVWILSVSEGCMLSHVTWYELVRIDHYSGPDEAISWRMLPSECPSDGVWVDVDEDDPSVDRSLVRRPGVREAIRDDRLCVRKGGEPIAAALVISRGAGHSEPKFFGLVDPITGAELVERSF
jgi:hypothetical protein